MRERKKQATEKALREAALRLALEHGPDNVRVDDIAEAAGVSPRTYNNYFSSREEAILAEITAEREARVARALAAAESRHARSAVAVVEAVVLTYTDPGDTDHAVLLLIATAPSLRHAFLDTTAAVGPPLTAALTERFGPEDAEVLAASVAAAVRIALQRWLRPMGSAAGPAGLVVPTGSLPDLLRGALAPLIPALEAADGAPPG